MEQTAINFSFRLLIVELYALFYGTVSATSKTYLIEPLYDIGVYLQTKYGIILESEDDSLHIILESGYDSQY